MNRVRMNKVIRDLAPKISSQSCNFKILVNFHEGLQGLNKVKGNQ